MKELTFSITLATKNKSKEAPLSKKSKRNAGNESGSMLYAWICMAVIALVTYIAFSPSMQNTFTNWDDGDYVLGNPLVASNTVNTEQIFTTTGLGNYHPLTILTLAWNYQSGKFNPVGYHLENVLFHLFNTILVFFFIFLITRRNLLMAAIVALFFGIHPMHVESVSWVSERKDVLYVFFFLSGLISYFRYRESGKMLWLVFTFVLFILSCFSKGMAVVFPVALLLMDYLQGVKWNWKVILEKVPFLLIAVVFGIVAIKAQKSSGYIYPFTYTIPQRVAFASYGAIMYIVKFFVPINLVAYYPYPDLDKGGNIPAIFYLYPFLLPGITVLIYVFMRKEKMVVFGLLFYLVTIALVLQFLTVGKQIMADRYSYLSYVGLLLVLAFYINKVWQAKAGIVFSLRTPAMIVLIAGAIIFSVETYGRTQVWKDTETLWADQISKYPDDFYAYENRGNFYATINANEKAIKDFNKSISLKPTDFEAYGNRATVYKNMGQLNLALADYNKAISLDSTTWIIFFNRGVCYSIMGDNEKALLDFSKSRRLNANDDRICNAMGQSLQKLHRYAEALTVFSRAIELNPNNGDNWLNRSHAEFELDKKSEAKTDALKAQELGAQVSKRYLDLFEMN